MKIALFVHIQRKLAESQVLAPGRKSAQIIKKIEEFVGPAIPSSSRLLFQGRDVYLLRDDGRVDCLTQERQLGLALLVTDTVAAELRGRVQVLAARQEVRNDIDAMVRATTYRAGAEVAVSPNQRREKGQ